MRTLVIEKSALKNNLSVIKERAAGAVIYANLSGDGGGLRTVPLARRLRDDGPRPCAGRALWRRRS